MKNAPPSRNRAGDNTLTGLFSLFSAKLKQNIDDMLPAKVIAYDRATNRAQVQPLIVQVSTLGEQINRAQIASVPVLQLGGGGFVISFPIETGDLGWIKASDRDITFFLKNYTQAAPNTQRTHSFSDAVFIPDSFMKDVVINSEDAANLVIQNLDGTVRVAIWSDKVKITAPEIILDSPLTTCTGAFVAGTNPMYVQTATFNGDIDTTGDITADGDITAGTVSLDGHTHPGVQSGGSNTGAPNP